MPRVMQVSGHEQLLLVQKLFLLVVASAQPHSVLQHLLPDFYPWSQPERRVFDRKTCHACSSSTLTVVGSLHAYRNLRCDSHYAFPNLPASLVLPDYVTCHGSRFHS